MKVQVLAALVGLSLLWWLAAVYVLCRPGVLAGLLGGQG